MNLVLLRKNLRRQDLRTPLGNQRAQSSDVQPWLWRCFCNRRGAGAGVGVGWWDGPGAAGDREASASPRTQPGRYAKRCWSQQRCDISGAVRANLCALPWTPAPCHPRHLPSVFVLGCSCPYSQQLARGHTVSLSLSGLIPEDRSQPPGRGRVCHVRPQSPPTVLAISLFEHPLMQTEADTQAL